MADIFFWLISNVSASIIFIEYLTVLGVKRFELSYERYSCYVARRKSTHKNR